MVMLSPRQLTVPAGQRLLLRDVSWQDFEEILDELGESRSSRLAYDNGILEMLLERHRAEGRRAWRRATRAWVRGAIANKINDDDEQ